MTVQRLTSRRSRLADPPRILFIDEMLPNPLYGAGYPRAREVLESILAQGWKVSFFPMVATKADVEQMQGGLRNVDFQWGKGHGALRRVLRTHVGVFHAVWVSRPATIDAYLRAAEAVPGFHNSVYRIYDAEALFAPREAMRRSVFNLPSAPDQEARALAAEVAQLQDAHAITAVSFADARLLEVKTAAPVFVLGHRMKATPTANHFSGRNDLLFVGRLTGRRDESPNVDSLVWFVEEVMPELDRLLGATYRLHVAGLIDSDVADALAADRVILHGVVEDLTSLYNQARVFIAPTRFAAGIPRKVHDAFSLGLPCVVTPLLASQLDMTDGHGVLVAEGATGFAEKCYRLYTEEHLWNETRQGALEQLEQHFSDKAFDRSLQQLLHLARRPLN